MIPEMIKKYEDDKINDKKNDECNDNQNEKMKKLF